MPEERAQRRLAAILAADVVGYSRLMQLDEAGTLAALKARRRDVLQPTIASHRGRIVKVMGDGVLVEFASAVDAVECAVVLQETMDAANHDIPDERRIVLRIGINLGDVMVEGSDLYGDGVNIAARLEGIAGPGAVVVSDKVRSEVIGKLGLRFEDLGLHSLKNMAEPIQVYRVVGKGETAEPSRDVPAGKPSIAVLPFTNMSADPEQQYLSDGISEDIITELSRYKELLVIARNSSFQFRDRSIDMKRVARELGVGYLVEGSLRKLGNRLRITAQLIEATSNTHLWAERYDRSVDDIFAIQDQVTQTIAATLVGRVTVSSAEIARRKPTHLWAAYDYVLQAIEANNRTHTDRAEALLRKAIEVDPGYARAYAALAMNFIMKFYADYRLETLHMALEQAGRALSIDDNDDYSHAVMSGVRGQLSQWELARMHVERALSLNPNSVFATEFYALWLIRTGRAPEALETLEVALQRDPLQPPWYWEMRGMALLQEKRYGDVIESVSRKNPLQSWDHAALALAHAQLGHASEARQEAAIAVQMQPNFSIAGWAKTDPYKDPEHLQHILAGLRKAGLPE